MTPTAKDNLAYIQDYRSSTFGDSLAALERSVYETPGEDLPALIGELERLIATAWARLVTCSNAQPQPTGEDRLMDVEETARKLNVSKDWLYRRADQLAFTVRLGRKLRFSERGVEKYIRQRSGRS